MSDSEEIKPEESNNTHKKNRKFKKNKHQATNSAEAPEETLNMSNSEENKSEKSDNTPKKKRNKRKLEKNILGESDIAEIPMKKQSLSDPEKGWEKKEEISLLETLMQSLRSMNDTKSYSSTFHTFKWQEVKINDFTPEECRKKWCSIYSKVWREKALLDTITDAYNYYKNQC